MIWHSIPNTKATEEALAEDEAQKNDSATNSQNEDDNYMDSATVKDKDKTRSNEAIEYTKQKKQVLKNHKQNTNFKDSLQYHKIGLILILNEFKKNL